MCLADLIDFPVDRLPSALPKTWRDVHSLSLAPARAPSATPPSLAGAGETHPSTTTQGTAP